MSSKTIQRLAKTILAGAMIFTISILFLIIFYILSNGLRFLTFNFLSGNILEMGKEGGIFPSIISTIYLAIVCLFIAAPLGIGTAIFLTFYTQETKVSKIIRVGTDCLAGIPSIIFGLFGFVFFVIYLKLGWSILSGSLTLAAMILPTIIRTTEEAVKTVPKSYMEVNYALGGTKWQGIIRIILPKASPGILTGIILSMGRVVSETAALILTAGMSVSTPSSIFSSGRSMAVHFYILAREGISVANAFATASVLLIIILLINIVSYLLMFRFIKKYR